MKKEHKDTILVIILCYLLVAFITYLIHYFGIVLFEYGSQYNIFTVPLDISIGIFLSIIGFDLIISLLIAPIVLLIIWIILGLHEKK